MMFFSNHGTPDSWTNNHAYGCHTFKWVNRDDVEFVYVNYHFLAKQKQFTAGEATELSGQDPDYSKKELWNKMENGGEVEYVAHVQIMKPDEADANLLGFDPFDVTKVRQKWQFPVCSFITPSSHHATVLRCRVGEPQEFGHLVFNKNPENFHRDVEQAAFSTGSMVPGIEDSPGPLLQFRMFFYRDSQYITFASTCTRFLSTAGSWRAHTALYITTVSSATMQTTLQSAVRAKWLQT
jgi:catalase